MAELAIFQDSRGPGFCRSCGAAVEWAETARGARMPFNAIVVTRTQPTMTGRVIEYVDSTVSRSHFATCPDAKTWRRSRPR
jgi:hypothetical protein